MRKLVPSNGGALLLSRHERQLNDAGSHLRADLRLNALYRTLEKFAHTLIHRAVAASQLGDAKMIAILGSRNWSAFSPGFALSASTIIPKVPSVLSHTS